MLAGIAACGPQFVPATSPVQPARLTDEALVARDGVVLPVARWTPAASPTGIVLALHSFGDFRLAFEEWGPHLADAGFLTVAFDQRGFGESPGHGRWWGRERLVQDARDAIDLLREAHPGLPVHLLGESMGGAVALLAAAGNDAVGRVVVAAPAVRAELPYRWAWDLGFATAATIWPGFTREVDQAASVMTDAAHHRLDSDPRVVRAVRVDTYWGLLRLANEASAVDASTLPPTFLLYGTADDTVPEVSLCALAAALGGNDAVHVIDGAGHRLLQGPSGQAAWPLIRKWLRGEEVETSRPAACRAGEQAAGQSPIATHGA
jgi:acylglycerol lipase